MAAVNDGRVTAAPLPSPDGRLHLTDGGLETVLIFHDGLDLPEFAAFPLVDTPDGRARLERYYDEYVALAQHHGTGVVLETPTWRASRDWGAVLGYDAAALARVNAEAVALVRRVVEARAGEGRGSAEAGMLVSGCVGPRGDGYLVEDAMSAADAADYHFPQVAALHAAGADLVSALTITSSAEAAGIVLAAQQVGAPVVISFTVEVDGRLPSGEGLAEAIGAVDEATGAAAAYFMVNCAHPVHVAPALDGGDAALQRLRGLRANASTLSHAELDAADELDDGDPADLGERFATLVAAHPQLRVVGGCCGTDARHVAAIAAACSR